MKNPLPTVIPFFLFGLICAVLIGCATVKQGEDPLVVRVEQAEATAKATFDLVLNIDHSDRGFWRTNAPAFHGFCEWLRQPQVVWVTNVLPRASAMIASLNDIKVDYIMSKQSSNAVITALTILQSAANEAAAWSVIVTNTNR